MTFARSTQKLRYEEKTRFHSLTALRGLAAIWAIAYHALNGHLQSYPPPLVNLVSHGHLAVDLFFVLSGFVMAFCYGDWFSPQDHVIERYATFLVRRVARVYPLYLLALMVVFTCSLAVTPTIGSSRTALTVFLNLFMVQTWFFVPSLNAPSWSVSAECFAYILFPALAVGILYSNRWVATTIAGACFAALCWVMFRFPAAHSMPLLRCLAEFSFGLVAYRFYQYRRVHRLLQAIVLFAFGLMLLLPQTEIGILLMFAPIVLVAACPDGICSRILSSEGVVRLGDLSYALYLLHTPIFSLRPYLVGLFTPITGSSTSTTVALLLCALLLSCSWLAMTCVEGPARMWIRKKDHFFRRNVFVLAPR